MDPDLRARLENPPIPGGTVTGGGSELRVSLRESLGAGFGVQGLTSTVHNELEIYDLEYFIVFKTLYVGYNMGLRVM